MPDGQVLEFSGVTKRFGAVTAVSGFSARVEPGVVTGFLGPNGAGKTTTLRILLGLVRASEGTATIGGQPYAKLRHPLQTVGAVLEASSFHPGRTAANHLKVYAQAAGLPTGRVEDALATVGLAEVAGRKVGGFSLGMRQRLGLAYALLGDPGVLVLDEPANGLDPEGIKWMRGLLRELARQGRTVLVSSHLLAEVQQTADALLIISQGRLVFQGRIDELTDPTEYVTVVDSPDRAALTAALREAGLDYEVLRSGLTVRSGDTLDVGRVAAAAGIALSTLQRRGPGLEEVFLDLVNGARVHASAGAPIAGVPIAAPVEAEAEAPAEAAAAPAAEPAPTDEPARAEAPAPAEEPAAVDEPVGEESVVETDAAIVVEAADTPATEDADARATEDALDEALGAPAATTPDEAVGEAPADEAVRETPADGAPADDAPADDALPHASFAVATTGIIEVIPDGMAPDDPAPDAPASPDAPAEDSPAQGAPADDAPAGAESEPEATGHVWAMPAASSADAETAPAVDETVGAELVEETADEAPVEETADDVWPPAEPRTEADEEADRFFSAFDAGDGEPAPDAPTTEGDDPAPDEGAGDDPPAASDTGDAPAEHEGGEQR